MIPWADPEKPETILTGYCSPEHPMYDTYKRCWAVNRPYGVAGAALGEIIHSRLSRRLLARRFDPWKILSGRLENEGEVGLIQPGKETPVLVRRESSTNGIEYLMELE